MLFLRVHLLPCATLLHIRSSPAARNRSTIHHHEGVVRSGAGTWECKRSKNLKLSSYLPVCRHHSNTRHLHHQPTEREMHLRLTSVFLEATLRSNWYRNRKREIERGGSFWGCIVWCTPCPVLARLRCNSPQLRTAAVWLADPLRNGTIPERENKRESDRKREKKREKDRVYC